MSENRLAEEYAKATEKTSDLVRQLSFAGVGIVWILSGGATDAKQPNFSTLLLWAGLALVLALGFDFLHAAYRSLSFGILHGIRERGGSAPSPELDLPRWFHWPSLFFFYGKMFAVVVAYVLLAIQLVRLIYGVP